MTSELGEWAALTPIEIGAFLRDARFRWWIAGGWAIELFVGRPIRPHDDLDVQVLREEQGAVQATLAGWDLQAADPPGTFRPWHPSEVLPTHVHDVWCRPDPTSPWALQLMLADTIEDRWVFRRDPGISRPLDELTHRTADGLPSLAPEVQLLYKAKAPRFAKNEIDLDVVLPLLGEIRRAWLATALATWSPGHPWIARL
jgi:hypothetical protein